MCTNYYIVGLIIIVIIIIILYGNKENFLIRDHRNRYRSYYTDLSGRNIWYNWNGRRYPYYYYPQVYYDYFSFPYSYYNPCVETVNGEIMCYY